MVILLHLLSVRICHIRFVRHSPRSNLTGAGKHIPIVPIEALRQFVTEYFVPKVLQVYIVIHIVGPSIPISIYNGGGKPNRDGPSSIGIQRAPPLGLRPEWTNRENETTSPFWTIVLCIIRKYLQVLAFCDAVREIVSCGPIVIVHVDIALLLYHLRNRHRWMSN